MLVTRLLAFFSFDLLFRLVTLPRFCFNFRLLFFSEGNYTSSY